MSILPARPRARPARRRRASRRVARTEAGMTLVELMVAMSIIAIIMSGLALSIGIDYKAVALARARQVAESTANKRLEELRDVDYASLALESQPVHSTDPDNPDYYVSASGTTYDVTGSGDDEALIVDAGTGPVLHIETPVTVGTTVVDVYQYVTWVDAPGIAGTQNLKRITVVVQYHSVPTIGQAKFLRESVILTPGNVTLGASATTTTTTTTSPTSTSSTSSTTVAPGGCGTFAIAGSSGASIGFTASATVTISMSFSGCGSDLIANFSNDGGATWGSDFSYSASATTLAWTVPSGDGTKTISGRLRSDSGGPWAIPSQSIVLDTTPPTTPSSIGRTASCSGNTRTVVLLWSAASDTYLVGYHVYVSTDGTTWSLLASTSGLTATTTNSKKLTSVRYYVKAYDSAGNQSSATTTISLSKNQCS